MISTCKESIIFCKLWIDLLFCYGFLSCTWEDITVCKSIVSIMRPLLGPKSMQKLIVDHKEGNSEYLLFSYWRNKRSLYWLLLWFGCKLRNVGDIILTNDGATALSSLVSNYLWQLRFIYSEIIIIITIPLIEYRTSYRTASGTIKPIYGRRNWRWYSLIILIVLRDWHSIHPLIL